MSKRSPNSPPLLTWAQNWARLDRQTMDGFERALRDAGLLSVACNRTENAAWLLLTLCTGLPVSVPAGSLAALGFEFGDVVSATAGGDLLRRSALVSHEAFAALADVLGPLPAEHGVALDLFWPVQTPATEPAATIH